MPVYLNESEFGTATDVVGFPHLLICMGHVALTNNAMFGMHSDIRTDVAVLAQDLAAFMANRGVHGADITALYGCGNWAIRYGRANQEFHWQTEMREAAAALGFHGPARGFDTSIIAPIDGTYVEYRPNYPAHLCQIYYKRHEKMNYQTTFHTNAAAFNPDIKRSVVIPGMSGVRNVPSETLSAAGNLHEVDYALRLRGFNI
jgi:hypothetical protein